MNVQQPLQGIFLDFYGTLAGGDRQAVELICQAVIDDLGLTLSASDLAVRWGHRYFAAIEDCRDHDFRNLVQIEYQTLIETVEPLAGAFDARPYVDRLSAYLADPPLFEEVPEVLAALRLPVCIVSNADDHELRLALDRHGLRFAHVVTSESTRSYKPHPGIFQVALARTGWSADRVVHVGDSLHSDVGGAKALGLKAAWLHRVDRISDIGTATPDFTWPDLRPLLSLQNGSGDGWERLQA